MNEESILHFIRSMNAVEDDTYATKRGERYQVRGNSGHYEVWDNYLLQDVNDLEHSNHINHYIRLAADLNADEHAIQHDYDKELQFLSRLKSKE